MLVVDANGTPLGCVLSGANRHDSQLLEQTLNAVPMVHSGRRVRLAFDLSSSTPTRATTRRVAASNSARRALCLALPSVAFIAAKRWDATVGSLSVPSPGSIAFDASKCATSDETTST
jgi:hypothetical protein